MNIGLVGRDEDFFQKLKLHYNVAVYDSSMPENLVLYDKDVSHVEYIRPSMYETLDFLGILCFLADIVFVFEDINFDSYKTVVYFKPVETTDKVCFVLKDKLFGNKITTEKVLDILKKIDQKYELVGA